MKLQETGTIRIFEPDTGVHTVDDIERRVLELEEEAFQRDIIQSFELRGWALYEFGEGLPLVSYLDLQPIVEMGREKVRLKHGIRYVPLPLHERDADWATIRDLVFAVVSQGRGPYFVDLEEKTDEETGETWVEPVGVYLIDSVVLDPPFLNLVIDPRLSRIKDPSRIEGLEAVEIPVHLACLHVIRNQLMKCMRVI